MALPDLPRHTLVWLRPDAVRAAPLACSDVRLRGWFAAGKPAVVARRQGDERSGHVRLGIALPPAVGKLRLGTVVPADWIARWREPLTLAEVLGHAPPGWRGALRQLSVIGRQVQQVPHFVRDDTSCARAVSPRVYGSFAWQALTADTYVTVTSDIDLMWRPANEAQAQALIAALGNWEKSTGRRADGELLFGDGAAVCWREWAAAPSRVLVKSAHAVELRPRGELASLFA